MPRHVVVDGSNIGTEGRSMPSLKQLNEAVMAWIRENPTDLITVVVDATFGHRIDPREVAEFDEAVANNEIVAPPAGAIGRGDAFVLAIADKANATIFSNDSFQEFHGDYLWLFDEGRLIGGKPVPHIGWVFVARVPVRGPTSRKAVREAKRKGDGSERSERGGRGERAPKASKEANQPMPVPKAPPPGAVLAEPKAEGSGRGRGGRRGSGREPKPVAVPAPVTAAAPVAAAAPAGGAPKGDPGKNAHLNDLLSFLGFVEQHPVGTTLSAIVESYSSHGAYVKIGDVSGYVPLRLMADPAPRSARTLMAVGEAVTLVVAGFNPGRRGIDLGLPGMVPVSAPAAGGKKAKGDKADKPAKADKPTKSDKPAKGTKVDKPVSEKSVPEKSVTEKPAKRGSKKTAPAADAPMAVPVVEAAPAPAKPVKAAQTPAKKAAAKPAPVAPAPVAPAPAKQAPAKQAPAKQAPAKKAPAKKTVAPAATAPAAPVPVAAKKAPAKAAAKQAAPAKVEAPAKQAPARQAPAKKAPAKKAPAKKAPAAKAGS